MGTTTSCPIGCIGFCESRETPVLIGLNQTFSISSDISTLTDDSYTPNLFRESFDETTQTTKELNDVLFVINNGYLLRNRTYIDTLKSLTYIDIA